MVSSSLCLSGPRQKVFIEPDIFVILEGRRLLSTNRRSGSQIDGDFRRIRRRSNRRRRPGGATTKTNPFEEKNKRTKKKRTNRREKQTEKRTTGEEEEFLRLGQIHSHANFPTAQQNRIRSTR